jgi:hypothetical protein
VNPIFRSELPSDAAVRQCVNSPTFAGVKPRPTCPVDWTGLPQTQRSSVPRCMLLLLPTVHGTPSRDCCGLSGWSKASFVPGTYEFAGQ